MEQLNLALVWYYNEKFFDGILRSAASKFLAAVAHEWLAATEHSQIAAPASWLVRFRRGRTFC